MASRSLQTLFTQAAAARRTAGRGSLLAITAALVAHAILFFPVAPEVVEVSAPTVAERLPTAVATASEVEGELAALPRQIGEGVRDLREALRSELVGDLQRLGDTVAALRATPVRAPTDEDARTGSPGGEDPRVAELADRARRDIGSMDWILAVRDAEPGEALLAALEPVVEARITEPRFAALERRWDEELVGEVRSRLDAASAGVSRLRGLAPEERAVWDELTAGSRDLFARLGEARPRLPEDPRWWWTDPGTNPAAVAPPSPAAGSPGPAPVLVPDRPALERLLVGPEPPPLVEIAESLHRRALAARDDLERRLARLREAGGEVDDGPLRGDEIPLDRVPPVSAPLALALLLTGLSWWRTRADRETILAAALFVESGGPIAVRDWTLAQGRAPVRPGESRPSLGGWWGRAALECGASLVWIGGLAVQAGGMPPATPPGTAAATAGAALLAGSLLLRVTVLAPLLDRLRRAADADEDSPADVPAARAPMSESAAADSPSADADLADGVDSIDGPDDLDGHPLVT